MRNENHFSVLFSLSLISTWNEKQSKRLSLRASKWHLVELQLNFNQTRGEIFVSLVTLWIEFKSFCGISSEWKMNSCGKYVCELVIGKGLAEAFHSYSVHLDVFKQRHFSAWPNAKKCDGFSVCVGSVTCHHLNPLVQMVWKPSLRLIAFTAIPSLQTERKFMINANGTHALNISTERAAIGFVQ